jgi:hypothetical protein
MSQNVVLQLLLSGAWTDIPLYSAAPATHQRGVEPFSTSWPRPANFTCEINNSNLAYDPTRPESVLYGLAAQGTPARLYINSVFRLAGEAVVFDPDATPEHRLGSAQGRAWVNFTAAGPLERIAGWTDVVRSPMWRSISVLTATLLGHWPIEDGPAAARLTNTVTGGVLGALRGGPSLGESDRPAGAAATAKLSGSAQRISGNFLRSTNATGWQVAFSARISQLPGAATQIIRINSSNGYTWRLDATATGFAVTVLDALGATVGSGASTYAGFLPTTWMTMRLKVSISGGTVTVEPAWYLQDNLFVAGFTFTFAGTIGFPYAWWADSTTAFDLWMCHVYAVSDPTQDLLSAGSARSFNGHRGERTDVRAFRILTELGITGLQRGTFGEGTRMGAQPVASGIDILAECRATDPGSRIDDTPTTSGPAVTVTTSRFLRAQTPTLTLDYAAGHVAPPFRPVVAAVAGNVANNVTVKNANAGEAVRILTSGPLSNAAPPAGINDQKQTVDVNLYDETTDLPERANWELARLTVPTRRFTKVVVDLLANPSLAATVATVREGDHIVVTNYPPDDVHLMVTGITEVSGVIERSITFETEPHDIWNIGRWTDGTWRWGCGRLAISGSPTSAATSWTVTSPERLDMLTPGATSVDYVAGGERVTVTNVGAVTGSGPFSQVLTVTRSVNGVVKAQTTNTSIAVYNARRWGIAT